MKGREGRLSIRDLASGEEVLKLLEAALDVKRSEYVALVAEDMDGRVHPFAILVGIILSQNTNDRNSIRAYLELRRRVGVTPEAILSASDEEIASAIRVAGLARQKTRALKEAARRVVEAGGEEVLLRLPWRELRDFLLSIPGVGKKTADVFLALVRRAPVFAVDTHAARIAKRWGLVDEGAGYDEISSALLSFFGPENSERAHRLLIALGRTYCKARRPLCSSCPVRSLCPYPLRASTPPGGRA